MPDEPTLGEVVRRFEDRFTDLRDDIQQLGRRIDGKVSQDLYELRHETLTARVKALEDIRVKDAERLAATRRWLIGAVIVPLVAVLLPILMSMGGKG
ncbi:hypothetical protein [Streptomyces sp. NPDC021224]|uniref:hypothetical protein n=1 Tax=unclassified Streptomyces TaxID=2593676 RepID=UPI0037901001